MIWQAIRCRIPTSALTGNVLAVQALLEMYSFGGSQKAVFFCQVVEALKLGQALSSALQLQLVQPTATLGLVPFLATALSSLRARKR